MILPLTLGIISSWHCLGMCGPLFSAILFSSKKNHFSTIHFLLYHFSRIAIYLIIGLIPIALGLTSISIFTQQLISIACGILILIFTWLNYSKNLKLLSAISSLVKKINAKGIKIKNSSRYILLGAANGLLPCGMVYVALAASIGNMQNINPAIFMMIFGIATLPVFFALFFISKTMFGNTFFSKLFKLKPYILSFVAILLILRGLNLNIPLISPSITNEKGITEISCCHDPKK